MSASLADKLAVCSWSLQPENPAQLIEHLHAVGLARVQLAIDPLRENPVVWNDTAKRFRDAAIEIVSGMFGTAGEDYSTLDSIRQTGGLVPDHTWDENWENAQITAQTAARLGLKLVTFHAGFLPHDESEPEFDKLQHRVRLVADLFASHGIDLAFETGQESADTLKGFLEKLGRANVGVNFDPANLLLYDKGDPIAALPKLGPWIKQCHIKDARRTVVPGTWGEEVVVGTGVVNWPEFFNELRKLQFHGWLCIEREAGTRRIPDIIAARKLVETTC